MRGYYRVVNRMAFVCLASLSIFAGGLPAWSAIMWYKGRGPRDRKRVGKLEKRDSREEPLEQLAS